MTSCNCNPADSIYTSLILCFFNFSIGIRESDISDITSVLHDAGIVVWHNVPKLRDVVIIDPQWFADALAGVVTFISQQSVSRFGGVIDWSRMQGILRLK